MDIALHIIGGFLVSAAIMWIHWLAIPALLIMGFLREQAQHRWILTVSEPHDDGIRLYMVEKQTFFGWITGHRLWEVAQWGIGATIAAVAWQFIK
jgi:hypothetical protein